MEAGVYFTWKMFYIIATQARKFHVANVHGLIKRNNSILSSIVFTFKRFRLMTSNKHIPRHGIQNGNVRECSRMFSKGAGNAPGSAPFFSAKKNNILTKKLPLDLAVKMHYFNYHRSCLLCFKLFTAYSLINQLLISQRYLFTCSSIS